MSSHYSPSTFMCNYIHTLAIWEHVGYNMCECNAAVIKKPLSSGTWQLAEGP